MLSQTTFNTDKTPWCYVVVVVVALLFYVHGKHLLRSCRDGQLT